MKSISNLLQRLSGQRPDNNSQATSQPVAPQVQPPSMSPEQQLLDKYREVISRIETIRPLRQSHDSQLTPLRLYAEHFAKQVADNQSLPLMQWAYNAIDLQSDYVADRVMEDYEAEGRQHPPRWKGRDGLWRVNLPNPSTDDEVLWDDDDDLEDGEEDVSVSYGYEFACLTDAAAILIEQVDEAEGVQHVAYSPNGEAVVVSSQHNVFWTADVPAELITAIDQFCDQGIGIRNVSFGPNGAWVVIGTDSSSRHGGVSTYLGSALAVASRSRMELKQVAFAPDGGWIVTNWQGDFLAHDVPQDLLECLAKVNTKDTFLNWVAIAPNGGWVVSAHKGLWSRGIPAELETALRERDAAGRKPCEIARSSFTTGLG